VGAVSASNAANEHLAGVGADGLPDEPSGWQRVVTVADRPADGLDPWEVAILSMVKLRAQGAVMRECLIRLHDGTCLTVERMRAEAAES
jgi:hypothetical protein